MTTVQDRRMAVVARVHREWALEQRTTPDPTYSDNDPSQYTEGIDVVSANRAALDDLEARTDAALIAEGLPTGRV